MSNITWQIPGYAQSQSESFGPSVLQQMISTRGQAMASAFQMIYGNHNLRISQAWITQELFDEMMSWTEHDREGWMTDDPATHGGLTGDPEPTNGPTGYYSPTKTKAKPWSREYKKQNAHLFKRKKR